MQITSSIPNLIGGVSQQPELLRLPSHLEEQINFTSLPSRGLVVRHGTDHQSHIGIFDAGGLTRILDYGDRGVVYLNISPDGGVRMVDGGGLAISLYDAAGSPLFSCAYLACGYPYANIRVVKEANTTFLLNNSRVVVESRPANAAFAWAALLWVKSGNYGRTYSVTIPGYGTYKYTVPDGGSASQSPEATTTAIAGRLFDVLNGGAGGTGTGGASWAGPGVAVPGVTLRGSVISFPAAIAGVVVDDGSGGAAMAYLHTSVRSVGELPSRNAGDGFTIKIEGGDSSAAGDHYLRYVDSTQSYIEVADPREPGSVPRADTMPHRLFPYGGGFQLVPIEWAPRKVGDSNANPPPGFVGKTINDLFFYQDRMGLLSGEGCDISETGEYFNFYRTSVVNLLDSDPVSVTVNHAKVSTLYHAIPFNKRLLFFSDKAQFELTMGDYLSPRNAGTRTLTEFECRAAVRPVGIGSSLYFPADKSEFTAVYNYFVGGVDAQEDAVDVSGHVPTYIPHGVAILTASPANNMLFLYTYAEKAKGVYVYQFYQDGQQRLQSSWHHWDLGGTVLALEVVRTRVYIVVLRGGQIFSEVLDLNKPAAAPRLDRLFVARHAYHTITGSGRDATTRVTLPYTDSSGTYWAVLTSPTPGHAVGAVLRGKLAVDGQSVVFPGDLRWADLLVGRAYTAKATLGRLLLREDSGGGTAGISRGRTQVSRLWVNYDDHGLFDVTVSQPGRDARVSRSTGRVVGGGETITGLPPSGPGRFAVPVMGRNTDLEVTIESTHPLTPALLSIDWEGYHVSRGQRA